MAWAVIRTSRTVPGCLQRRHRLPPTYLVPEEYAGETSLADARLAGQHNKAALASISSQQAILEVIELLSAPNQQR
ncbi:MAG: hypothetical protein M3456_16610 [Actinomycetota bacterium]|nr:hypothetical protein [Actinomycetota bacterium]